jgi:hypothetical protein
MPEAEAEVRGLIEEILDIKTENLMGDEKEKGPESERCAMFCASVAATSKHRAAAV